jgi:hypothetical protein
MASQWQAGKYRLEIPGKISKTTGRARQVRQHDKPRSGYATERTTRLS